jgi:nucleoside-diphosphate-sugar epimerase
VGDKVKDEMEKLLGRRIELELKNIQDLRNYKVAIAKAKTILGFEPSYDIADIVDDLHAHREQYGDLDADDYFNIRVFRRLHESRPAVES